MLRAVGSDWPLRSDLSADATAIEPSSAYRYQHSEQSRMHGIDTYHSLTTRLMHLYRLGPLC